MKIALWNSYGTESLPKEFAYDKEKSFIENRQVLAKRLMKIPCVNKEYQNTKELAEDITNSEDGCVAIRNINGNILYYVRSDKYGNLGHWEVEDIDTSRLWLFHEYDGAEGIQYYELGEDNQLILSN